MYLLDVIMKTACNKVGKIIKIADPLRILRRWKKEKKHNQVGLKQHHNKNKSQYN